MKKILCIGDSLTSGENNDFVSYTKYLQELLPFDLVTRNGVSGTTIGDYSIYPVEPNTDLVSTLRRCKRDVAWANTILIEYGANDASAIMLGNITQAQVLIAFNKALDLISQINPRAKVYFLTMTLAAPSSDYAKFHCQYLKEYYGNLPANIFPAQWNYYYSFIRDLPKKKGIPLIPMFKNVKELLGTLSDDKIHPTDAGYRLIAQNIVNYFSA